MDDDGLGLKAAGSGEGFKILERICNQLLLELIKENSQTRTAQPVRMNFVSDIQWLGKKY